jgi:DNA-binding IclR family transcriptional regulator
MLRELLPAHATAAGKVLLAHRHRWRHSMLARPLERHTDRTLNTPAQLERVATEIRTRGYAVDDREYRPRHIAIAAPIFSGADDVPAAVAISTTTDDAVARRDTLVQQVLQTADAITRALEPLDRRTRA